MMFGLQPFFLAIMMIFGGGNEALDFVDTKSYWSIQGEEFEVEELILEVKKPSVRNGAGRKAKSIRRLMAIRTLGEMKEVKAMEVLKEMLNSEEMFVADYAREAINMIEGKPVVRKVVKPDLKADLALMPKATAGVGGITMRGGPPFDIAAMLKKMGMFFGEDANKNELMMSMQRPIVEGIEDMGNMRIDSFTVGVPAELGDNKGWVVISIRGEYDHKAFLEMMKETGLEGEEKGGVSVMKVEDSVNLGVASDHQLVFVAGAKEDKIPFESVFERMKSDDEVMRFGGDLKTLLNKTEKNGPVWASVLVSDVMKENDLLKDLSTLRLETLLKDDFLEMLLIGKGEEAFKVQQALGRAEELYQDFVKQQLPKIKTALRGEGEEVIDFLEGVEFRGLGVTGIVRGKMKVLDTTELSSVAISLMMSDFRGLGDDRDPFEGDEPMVEEALPAPAR